LQRSKKERTACYKHHSVPLLKGAFHSEKYESSFYEITYYCSGQLRILGLTSRAMVLAKTTIPAKKVDNDS